MRLSRLLRLSGATVVLASLLAGGCSRSSTSTAPPVLQASAVLRNAQGTILGTAVFSQASNGKVSLEIGVAGLAEGLHGMHLHTVGSCDSSGSTAFGAAGGHFNPFEKQHGLENPSGSHAGDLPNLEVGSDGYGEMEIELPASLIGTGPATLFDPDSSAIVIHANADDQRTDPSGNSGGRVACGVLTRGG